jgi:hypothetical protein
MKTSNKFFSVITVLVFTSAFTFAGSTDSTSNQAVVNNAQVVNETKTENLTLNLVSDQNEETFSYDLEREAMLYTKWVVDQQEAKLVQNLFAKSEELIEAEEFTSWVVDQEEAKQLSKVMNAIEGKAAAETVSNLLSTK